VNGLKKYWWVGVVVVVGMGVSARDYVNWRREETKNYGHGPLMNQANAMELGQRYSNGYVGFRMRYPVGWTQEEKLKKPEGGLEGEVNRYQPTRQTEVIKVKNEGGSVEVTVSVDRLRGDVVQVLDQEVERLESEGIVLDKEREYWHTEREDWGVVTWTQGEARTKRAYAVDQLRMVMVEVRCEVGVWDEFAKTLDEIIKAVTLIS
jgi:hypothetical protein